MSKNVNNDVSKDPPIDTQLKAGTKFPYLLRLENQQ